MCIRDRYSRFRPAISAAFFAANAVSGAVATTSDSVAGRARACWPCGEHAGRACGEYAIEAAIEAASIDPVGFTGEVSGKVINEERKAAGKAAAAHGLS